MVGLDEYFSYKRPTLQEKVESILKIKLNPLQKRAVEIIEKTEKNVIVSAPTGSGKTVIGYAALLKYGKGFYLAPLISLMMEKYHELSRLLPREYSVMVSNRDYRIPVSKFLSANFKIMSPYKFLVLSRSIDPNKHGKVLVVDEIHKMNQDPLFEAAITVAKRIGFRIIGLSATISSSDLRLLSKWLNAEVVTSTNRPVELKHHAIRLEFSGRLYTTKRCENIEELVDIVKGFEGDCRKALAGLRILRPHIYSFYKTADKILARYIESGGCIDEGAS